ncbi:MAG: hypothetical protein ABSC18_14960 [Verrucomicrobiota bacterium]|jgi:hypothetical protein
MSDDIIDVQAVEEQIVACPKCGQRNRVLKHDRPVAFRCGACRTELTNPFAVGPWHSPAILTAVRNLRIWRHRVALTLLAGLALLILGFIFFCSRKPPHQLTQTLAHAHDQATQPLTPPTKQPLQPSTSAELAFKPDVPDVSNQQIEPILRPPRSLPNGTLLSDLSDVGDGTLTIENGTAYDGDVKLIDYAGAVVVEFFVRA